MPLGTEKTSLFGAAGGAGGLSPGGNYLGDGSDGDVTISSNTELTVLNKSGSYDGDMIVKNYTSLTIDSGITLQPDQACRGMLIYVQGDCTINGTLRITQSPISDSTAAAGGANADPTATGGSDSSAVSSTGLRYPVKTSGGSDTLAAADFAGCGNAAVAAVANQTAISSNGDILKIEREGGAGGVGFTDPSGGPPQGAAGIHGTAGTTGGTTISSGGGGTGSPDNGTVGSGGKGSCFAGGAGSGGGHGGTSSSVTNHGGSAGTAGQCGACFVDGVMIELPDGSHKNISQIEEGDLVKTENGSERVGKPWSGPIEDRRLFGFNGEKPFVTGQHPFMTQDGWKHCFEIERGDTLYRNGKGEVKVESIDYEEVPEDTLIYNFHVHDDPSYYANDYLVHNKGNSGGGAGNPSGAGCGVGTKPSEGVGGLIFMVVGGDLTVASGATISAQGTNGGNCSGCGAGGGGSSGGGNIMLAHVGSYTNSGTVSAAGGTGIRRGGNGGAGGVHNITIT